MSKRKPARAIRNAKMRQESRMQHDKKREVERAIRAHGGERTPANASIEEEMPEGVGGVDGFEAMAEAEVDELETAINNPDFEDDEETEEVDNSSFANFLDDVTQENGGNSAEPEP